MKKRHYVYLGIFLHFIFQWTTSYGQLSINNSSTIHAEHFTTRQGLANNQVTSILQDRAGFMWFGTQAGLSRFDGYEFTNIKTDLKRPKQTFRNDAIWNLYEDKWGFITGEWPHQRYWQTMLVRYGLGLPLVCYSFYYNYQHTPTVEAFLKYLEQHSILWTNLIYSFQRILLVMAHASLIILLIQSGVVQGLLNRLGAVGQMAFTNYVTHTLICTGVFFGYGLNQFADWEFYQLYFLVAAIWVFQLIICPIWLRHYRFGPLEWAWRSLTYWQRQPMRRVS